jgi:hypothetical protein
LPIVVGEFLRSQEVIGTSQVLRLQQQRVEVTLRFNWRFRL